MPSILILEDDITFSLMLKTWLGKERLRSQFGIIGFGCTKPDRGCLFRFDLV